MLDSLFSKLLVISPHGDDEVLGCGGLISRVVTEVCNSEVSILLFGTTDIYTERGLVVSSEERSEEFFSTVNYFNRLSSKSTVSGEILFPSMELSLDQVGMKKAVSALDLKIEKFQPTAVLVCYASHHQDHQFVCNASIAALRPTPFDNIKLKAMYEYGYHEAWNPMNQVKMSKFYVDISTYIDNKIEAFKCYRSQQKINKKDLLHTSSIRRYAQSRGSECGFDYAEVLFPLTMRT